MALTKKKINQLAFEIRDYLVNAGLEDGVAIFFNNLKMTINRNGNEIQTVIKENIDPHDYFEYAAYNHILSMSFDGALYERIYYCPTGARELSNIFERYGLYYELGNAWNLTLCPCVGTTEIEYTYYKEPEKEIDLYLNDKCDIPDDIKPIMETWRLLSKLRNKRYGDYRDGAGFHVVYKGKRYFVNQCSPFFCCDSWEADIGLIEELLLGIGADSVKYDYGRF